MSDISVIGDWIIKKWDVHGQGPIPENAFENEGFLKIVKRDDGGCDLYWQNGRPCSIKGLPPIDERFKCLQASGIEVSFGAAPIPLQVCIKLVESSGQLALLQGDFHTLPGDGNTGTFIAHANPGPPRDPV
jgi:hypothetical protein